MGSFTQVDLDAATHVQFHTGDDQCQTYKVGDPVHWSVNTRDAGVGCCLDGVYHGEAYDGRADLKGHYWVVIKDHVLVAVVPVERNDPDDAETCARHGIFKDGHAAQQAYVAARYGVVEPPIEAWPDSAWARKAKADERSRRRLAKWDAEDYGKSPDEKATRTFGRFMSAKTREESFFRKVMPPTPLPEGSLDRSVPSLPEDLWGRGYPPGVAARITERFKTEGIPFWRHGRSPDQRTRARNVLAGFPRPMRDVLSAYSDVDWQAAEEEARADATH